MSENLVSNAKKVLVLGGPISTKATVVNLLRFGADLTLIARDFPTWLDEPAFSSVKYENHDLSSVLSFCNSLEGKPFFSASTSVSDEAGLSALVTVEKSITHQKRLSEHTLVCLDKIKLKEALERLNILTPRAVARNSRVAHIKKPIMSTGPSSWFQGRSEVQSFYEERISGEEFSILAWGTGEKVELVAALSKQVTLRGETASGYGFAANVQEDGRLISKLAIPLLSEITAQLKPVASAIGISGGFFTFDAIAGDSGFFVIDVGPGVDSGVVEMLDSAGISCPMVDAIGLLNGDSTISALSFVSGLKVGTAVSSRRKFSYHGVAVGVSSDEIHLKY